MLLFRIAATPALRMSVAALALALALVSTPTFAHPGAGHVHLFADGFLHPLGGLDHLLAAFAVGLWAALAQPSRPWIAPALFLVMMTASALVAASGVLLPGIEPGIAGSVLLLGLLIAMPLRLPQAAMLALIAAFAVFHGQAHGAEGAAGDAYLVGLVAATALLHAAGIAFGLLVARLDHLRFARAAGALIALAGAYLVVA